MKKKVIAIVVMVALVMSLVACSSTQAQPVQESTPAPKTETAAKSVEETKVAVTEEPKAEEPEIKEEHAAEASTETVVVDDTNIVSGIDCTAYNQSQRTMIDLWDFVDSGDWDDFMVFVDGDNGIEAVLVDGDTFKMEEGNKYSFVYYVPKPITSVNKVIEGYYPEFQYTFREHAVLHDTNDYSNLQKDESKSVEVDVVYEDGTEGAIHITLVKTY